MFVQHRQFGILTAQDMGTNTSHFRWESKTPLSKHALVDVRPSALECLRGTHQLNKRWSDMRVVRYLLEQLFPEGDFTGKNITLSEQVPEPFRSWGPNRLRLCCFSCLPQPDQGICYLTSQPCSLTMEQTASIMPFTSSLVSLPAAPHLASRHFLITNQSNIKGLRNP